MRLAHDRLFSNPELSESNPKGFASRTRLLNDAIHDFKGHEAQRERMTMQAGD